jgi:protein-S-isoprenylcysteine O-methyltransferase Ste14
MIYGNSGSSRAQRSVIVGGETAFAILAGWLLVGNGLPVVDSWLGIPAASGDAARRLALFLFVIATYLRMTVMITVFLKRSIGWEEAISVPVGFGVYFVGYALLGGARSVPFGALDVVGIVLFLAGAALNTTAELLRHRWRRDPSHRGKLYTGGLFRFSRHVNYFGDVVWVAGWALVTRNPWSAIVPVFLFCMFAFYNVPRLDSHLARKHGAEFQAYRSRTRGLVPFLF